MDADPEFFAGPSGTWTADGSYDAGSCRITFADADATWSENELAGKSVNPDIGQMLQFVIVTNTATTMTVWADWATIDAGVSWVTSGASYQMHDHHLTIESPCTDAGDPHFVPGPDERDIDGQMRVWDGDDDGEWIVDMGSDEFGSIIPGDLDGDGCVGHGDLGILLGDWGCTTGDCPGDCDFDGDTDHADLGILLGQWGEGCP
ncbi:MAG TPA: hypothetical protein VM243_15740 [Phycisphaerae bacterium]|nr:hypothetical protein [Phycisphaerae bacterium]